jgi:hypothetical protein
MRICHRSRNLQKRKVVVPRKRFFQAALALAMLGAMVVLQQSPAAAAAYGPYGMFGYQSQKCVDDPNGSTANVTMIIYTCLGGGNQRWYLEDTDTGYYQIVNQQSGKCLTVLNASTSNNAPIIQYACNTGDNEEWTLRNAWQDQNSPYFWYYDVVNRHSGRCITVKNASTNNGASLLQYTCNGGYNSQWAFPTFS